MIQGERRVDDQWRKDITQQMQLVNGELKTLKAHHIEMKASVDTNTQMTAKIEKNTNEIVEFFNAGKGFFTMMGYFAKAAKWLTAIAAACGVVWAALKLGVSPKQ